MSVPRYPALDRVNVRAWLTLLSSALGRKATLDHIPDAELERGLYIDPQPFSYQVFNVEVKR